MRRDAVAGDLSNTECWDRLHSSSLGRVALTARALPVIIPVQYYVDGTTIVICMGADPPFSPILSDVVAAFAVESIDPDAGSGWTVHVQGVLRRPVRPGHPEVCPTGDALVVRLEPAWVTGWRVRLCPMAAPERPAVLR